MRENIDFNSLADPEDVKFIWKNRDTLPQKYPGKCVMIENAAVVYVFDNIAAARHYIDEAHIEKYLVVDLSTGIAYTGKLQANSKEN